MDVTTIYILSFLLGLFCSTTTLVAMAQVQDSYLTDFNYGVSNGQTRNFTLLVEENNTIPITSPNDTNTVYFPAWTFNGTVPGPTMRMTEGDHVFIKVINSPDSKHLHSLHMHSIHSPSQDGTFGKSGSIMPGESHTYEFVAGPAGLYPYHCHVEPVVDHINRGLYGAMIIDPPTPRPQANEVMMLMNSYDLDLNEEMAPTARVPTMQEANDIMYPPLPDDEDETGEDVEEEETTGSELEIERDNEFYTINGRAFEYMDNPIELKLNEPVRIYLLSMTEFDPVNSFHLHSGMFNYTSSGTLSTPPTLTDIVTIGQGDRGIIEFIPQYTGKMMIHAHINEFTNLGWMGTFEVVD